MCCSRAKDRLAVLAFSEFTSPSLDTAKLWFGEENVYDVGIAKYKCQEQQDPGDRVVYSCVFSLLAKHEIAGQGDTQTGKIVWPGVDCIRVDEKGNGRDEDGDCACAQFLYAKKQYREINGVCERRNNTDRSVVNRYDIVQIFEQ